MKLILSLALLVTLPLSAAAKQEAFKVDPAQSKVEWEGKKIIGSGHKGELKIQSGSLQVEKGKLVGGEFAIDMKTLTNTDLSNEGMNKKLVGHLHSDDFFSTEKYPVSTLKIKKVEAKGAENLITGDLTIKNITKPISFPAKIKVEKDKVTAESILTVDRTAYDVRYNSLKFFSKIGDKAIDDKFTVKVNLIGAK